MRVLELSDGEGAAAFAGKLLARWGAEVIKIESPARTVPTRAADLAYNGGKRRVAADFREPPGRDEIEALARRCNVILTDAPAADVNRYDLLALGGATGPSVRLSITPFGLSGPYAEFAWTPATVLALSGYTFIIGEPGRAPLTLPDCYVSAQAGSYGYVAALAAVIRAGRAPDLEPVRIELSLLECLATPHQFTDSVWVERQHIRGRNGNRMESAANSMLPTKDGWVGVSVQPQFWESFCLMMGRPELARDHPLATTAGRMANRDAYERVVIEAFKERTSRDVFHEAQETWRVPIGQLKSFAEVLDDPHLGEREFWPPVEGSTPMTSGLRVPGSPFRFSRDASPAERAPEPMGSSKPDGLSAVIRAASGPTPAVPVRSPARPLEGIRVLDLSRVWAGPLAARVFADLGADVIKVEAPTGRGPGRVAAGTRGYADGDDPWNRQTTFNKLQRNRRGVCVDLKTDRGREIFLELVAVSDVVLENFSARAMASLGLGYDQLRAVNPRIIYAPMPAFGKTGIYSDFIGLGTSVEPLTALPQLLGYPGGSPMSASIAIPDPIAALAAVVAVVTAIDRRERTGEGTAIDLSQREATIGLLGEYFVERQLTGQEPERLGNGSRLYCPQGVYRCSGEDEWIALAARDPAEWAALCRLAGRGWEGDPRFATADARRSHCSDLDAAIESWTNAHDKFDLMQELTATGVPAGVVATAPEYLADAQLLARGYFAELHHPQTGPQRYDGSPLLFNGERGYGEWTPPPMLGEHNWAVLHELIGLDEGEYGKLVADGVLADRPPY